MKAVAVRPPFKTAELRRAHMEGCAYAIHQQAENVGLSVIAAVTDGDGCVVSLPEDRALARNLLNVLTLQLEKAEREG